MLPIQAWKVTLENTWEERSATSETLLSWSWEGVRMIAQVSKNIYWLCCARCNFIQEWFQELNSNIHLYKWKLLLVMFCCCFQISLRDVVLRILQLFTTIKNVMTGNFELGWYDRQGLLQPMMWGCPSWIPLKHRPPLLLHPSSPCQFCKRQLAELLIPQQSSWISDKAKKIKVSSETAPVTVSILISEKNTACLSAHRKKVFLLWENLTGSQTRGIKKTQKEREKKWRR